MYYEILPNGSLSINIEQSDVEAVNSIRERCGNDDGLFMSELLEYAGWTANGRLFQVRPEQVGALTDSPLLTDEMQMNDQGDLTGVGTIWWYPWHEHQDFAERLISEGAVRFAKGS